ncbi:nitrate/nitrite sensing protein [Thermovibrio guaymasensis]|uniref:Nitrate/nitrite sensing protein n=1 Tax=Thermovibrio guaymasensis TaxID=240167 RepID=A0A420W9F7_9BACT|nr:nitrate- and nitrite sensing domain-containing protein [Thermovibrio guaymasensis]RKQ63971.1 nitrate/nitrite sensing protein [Thermovibrio guaymasensis]
MSFKHRIILLSLVSLFSIFTLSYFLLTEARHSLKNAESLEKSVILSTKISELVHELQKERGRTAGFLGSGGKTFKEELQEQRKLTDLKIKELEKYLNKEFVSSLSGEAQKLFLSVILNGLDNLSQVRVKVDSLQISLEDAINFYTKLNSDLIDSVALLAKNSKNAEIANELLAYTNFMYAKDKAGLERAVLSVAFANKMFPDSKLFTKFVDLLAQQKAFIKSFSLAAPERVIDFYKKTVVSSGPSEQVLDYERLALTSPFTKGALNVDPNQWFRIITQKIDLMHKVELFIAKDLIGKIKEVKFEAKSRFNGVLVVSVVAIAVILIVSIASLRGRGE